MPPQAAFTAALARSRQREEQKRCISSTSVRPSVKREENFNYKREPSMAEDLYIINELVVNPVKERYCGGIHAQDPIELSDDDVATLHNEHRTATSKQAKKIEAPPTPLQDYDKTCHAQQSVDIPKSSDSKKNDKTETVDYQELPTDLREQPSVLDEKCLKIQLDGNDRIPSHANTAPREIKTREAAETATEPAKIAKLGFVPNIDETASPISKDPLPPSQTDGEPKETSTSQRRVSEAINENRLEVPTKSKDRLTSQHNGNQANTEERFRAPTAFMGPVPALQLQPKSAPSFVDLCQEDEATPTAKDDEHLMKPEVPDLIAEKRLRKAQKTLSDMEKILREQKRKAEVTLSDTCGVTESERNSRSHASYSRKLPGIDHSNACTAIESPHTGPSGFQIGLASLGLGDPDILREYDGMTHRRTQLEESRMTAADAFMRDSPSPPPPPLPLPPSLETLCGLPQKIGSASRPRYGDDIPSRKRPYEETTITSYFPPKRRPPAKSRNAGKTYKKNITLDKGYFKRHEDRVKALKTRAENSKRAHEERFDGQEQSLFLNSDSDNDYQVRPHPETGGKGLSLEAMQSWKAAYPTPSQSEQEELETPKMLYEYHVSRRTQLACQEENQARTTTFGPFYTTDEANVVAAAKARQPSEEYASSVFRPGAWSYRYDKDDAGLESHVASGKGGTIQTWVTRSIAPPNQDIGIPLKAFTTPAWIYIAMFSSAKKSYTGDDQVAVDNEVIRPDDYPRESTVIKCCTLLDLANRAASRKWIELQAGNLPNDGLSSIHRAEMEMHMRQDLERMDEENLTFDRTYRNPTSGLETRIWVEMVEVEGPRN